MGGAGATEQLARGAGRAAVAYPGLTPLLLPPCFAAGEFVGGADIVEQMHGSGELRGMLERAGALSK